MGLGFGMVGLGKDSMLAVGSVIVEYFPEKLFCRCRGSALASFSLSTVGVTRSVLWRHFNS